MNNPSYIAAQQADQMILYETGAYNSSTEASTGTAPLAPLIEAHPWLQVPILILVLALTILAFFGPLIGKFLDRRQGR